MSLKHHDDERFNCVCDVVHFINDLQDAVEDNESCPTNCLNPVLGANTANGHPHKPANTRPFILYLENGCPFEGAFKHDHSSCEFDCSKFFRVENVDGCCALLRVLKCVPGSGDHPAHFEATRSCITVDLNCFCAIQCLDDTHVSNL